MATGTATTPAGKSKNAISALNDLGTHGHADLVQKFASDFVSAGFGPSTAVFADISTIHQVSPSDADALSAMLNDRAALTSFVQAGLSGMLTPISDTLSNAFGGKNGIANLPSNTIPSVTSGLNSGLNATGIGAVYGLASALTQRNTWIRIIEGFVGLVILGVGVAALTKNTSAGKYAEKAVKYLK